MAGTSNNARELIVNLRLVAAESDNRKASDRAVAEVEKAQKRISDAHSRSVKEVEKAEEQKLKWLIKTERNKQRIADEEYRTLQRQEKAELNSLIKREKEKKRILDDEFRRMDRATREQERIFERSNARVLAGNKQLEKGLNQAASGVTAMVRGFALLGVASEQDLEKAVRAFAKIEAGIQVVQGVASFVKGATKAWQGYTAAVTAAGIAQNALGAKSALGAAGAGAANAAGGAAISGAGAGAGAVGASGAAAVGGVGLTIGAAVAAIAAVGTVIWELGEIASETGPKVGGLTDTIGSAEANIAQWVQKKTGVDLFKIAGFTDFGMTGAFGKRKPDWFGAADANAIEEKTKRAEARREGIRGIIAQNELDAANRLGAQSSAAERARANADEARQLKFGTNRFGANAQAMGAANARLTAASGNAEAVEARFASDGVMGASMTERVHAAQEELNAQQEIKRLTQERYDIERQTNVTMREGIRETVSGLLKMKELEQQRYETIQQESRNFFKAYDTADPLQRAQGAASLSKLDRGEMLNRFEEESGRIFGNSEDQKLLDKNQELRILAENPNDPLIKRSQERRAKLEAESNARAAKLDDAMEAQQQLLAELEEGFNKLTEATLTTLGGVNTRIEQATVQVEKVEAEAKQAAESRQPRGLD